LGSGGYADVYLYEQQSPRMPVAVKVLKSEGLTDALRAQFVDEADTMAQLGDHPYIVQVFRSGTADDGRPYLVMKYYPPPNLAMRARAERFTVEEVLRTGIQLASAVETAHRAHITHRDIKPANVLISAYGAPGLTDFGIAGRGGRDGRDGDVAESTDDMGVSVPWAAPEVLYGQSNGDERSDVYSLAATLWHLLVGRSPFEVPGGDNSAYALLPRIRSTPPPPTGRPDVPPGLERLLAQALAKDPSRRPAAALDLARALQAVEQQQRLARTPIVVLDEQGHTTLVSQVHGSPAGPETLDDDRTRIKAPQTVVAQPSSPATSLDADTRRRRDAGAPSAAPSAPFAPTGAGLAPTSALFAPVPVRPTAVTDPMSSSRTAPLVRDGSAGGGGYDDGDGPTVRRPVGTQPTQSEPTPQTTARPQGPARPTPALLWGLVSGLVVLVGVVAFLVLRPEGSDAETDAGPRPSPTVSMPGDDNAVPDAVFDAPTVAAESGDGSVTFRWSYPQPAVGDSYRLFVAPRQSEAVKAAPRILTKTTFTEKVPKGQQLCAVVTVNRGGRESPRSQVECETAR
jgi:serine/threonine protein kinase